MSRFPAVPTNSGFASALPFRLLSFVVALLTRSVLALAFGFSFVAVVIHGIDLHEAIVSGMVSRRVPLSFE